MARYDIDETEFWRRVVMAAHVGDGCVARGWQALHAAEWGGSGRRERN